jgi:ATP-dependent protease HslVU (ClpYQ) ATPase subunit
MKLILGPRFVDHPTYDEKVKDYREGFLDEYQCLIYVPTDKRNENSVFSHLKVKDIKKFMYEVYTDELFTMIDLEEFIKNEVENKGIVVIDEIDKLVRSVKLELSL